MSACKGSKHFKHVAKKTRFLYISPKTLNLEKCTFPGKIAYLPLLVIKKK